MMVANRFQVFSASGIRVSACRFAIDAACMVTLIETGATIRDAEQDDRIIWHEGQEAFPAEGNLERVAALLIERTTPATQTSGDAA